MTLPSMDVEPFIGSLCSATCNVFGPNVTMSSLVLSKIRMEESNLLLEVSLQHLNYETFSLEEFTHIVVGIVFQLTSDNLQYSCCVNWCHVKEEIMENVEINDASEVKSLNIVRYGIISKHLFLQIALQNMSETKMNQVDKKVMDQFFNLSLENFIDMLCFIKTSQYLSKYDKQTITDIETVSLKTKEISVNKIDKLFKQLTPADWSNNMLQVMKVIGKFEDLLKMKQLICESIKKCVIQRAKLCSSFYEKDIKYFVPSYFCDFKAECNKHNDLYLLIFCKEFMDKDRKQFDCVEEEFLKLKKNHQKSVFMLVDIDLLSEEPPFTPSETVICHLRNGCFLSYNVLVNETNSSNDIKMGNSCSIVDNQCPRLKDTKNVTYTNDTKNVTYTNDTKNVTYTNDTKNVTYTNDTKNVTYTNDGGRNYILFSKSDIEDLKIITSRALLCIPCPGIHLSDKKVFWYCKYCNNKISISFNSYIYCTCGRINLTKCKFVCTFDSKVTHITDEVFVMNYVEPRPIECLNLIIFGQNDADINTWRNNFHYYLSSMHDATEVNPTLKQLQNLISTMNIKSDGKESRISICNSANKICNLFSTPGVCPNFTIPNPKNGKSVLESLRTNIKYVDGICIIINAVDIKIKLKFKYFIQEILTYFHKDAIKNILFCVVSSEDMNEKTKLALEEVLSDINVPGLKNGRIYFFGSDTIDKVKSAKLSDIETHGALLNKWKTTKLETKKLIYYISLTKGHDMTMSVNIMRNRVDVYRGSCMPLSTDIIIPYQNAVFDYLKWLIKRLSDDELKTALKQKEVEHNRRKSLI